MAIDPDQPFDPYGVTYSLDSGSNPNGVFSINENGTISANTPVDREMTSQYKLKIKATIIIYLGSDLHVYHLITLFRQQIQHHLIPELLQPQPP